VLQSELALLPISLIFILIFLLLKVRRVDQALEALSAVGQQLVSELTELQIGEHGLHALHGEFKTHDLRAESGVEAGVVVLHLGLAEDGLDHDALLGVVGDELVGLLVVAGLALALAVAEHQTTELHALLVVVVGSDLIEPETHILIVVFGLD